MKEQAKKRIIVALDVSSANEALSLVNQLKGHVGLFKVGLELFSAVGPSIVRDIRNVGEEVFLDLKFHDIPNTVARSSSNAASIGVSMFSIHITGGREMMSSALIAAREKSSRISVLGVTLLTSLDVKALNEELQVEGSTEAYVSNLARLAMQSNLHGVIASPRELQILRQELPSAALIVTPGIRPLWAQANDQKRYMTPAEAIRNGASYLVIGRPITNPPETTGNPCTAADLIADEISAELNI